MPLSVRMRVAIRFVSLSIMVLLVSSDIDWIQSIPKLPIPLMQACIATTANNTIYIFGGYTDNLIPSKKIYLFNPSTNIIHTLNISTPTNQFICNHNAVYSNITNKIYIIGIDTDDTADWSHTTNNYEFDPTTHEFTPISNAANNLKASCIAIYNSSIYVYGGFDSNFVSTLFIYDIWSEQWTQKASSAEKIFNGACYASDNSFYSFGGWNPDRSNSVTGGVITDITRYNLEMNSWSTVNTLAYYKWQMRAVRYNAMDDTVIIIGGYGLTYEQTNSFKMEAYSYKNNDVSDIGELDETQGGELMVIPYMDDIMILGGNSYWQDNIYDDIYISHIPTQVPTLGSLALDLGSTTTIYTTNTVGTVTAISDNTFEIPKIVVIVGSTSLGIICVLMCCYIFYKERNSRNVKQEIHTQNASNNKLHLPKQKTITLTPPGTGNRSITVQRYMSIDNDEEVVDVMDIGEDDNEGVEGVGNSVHDHEDVLNEALSEVLRMQSNMDNMSLDSDGMYENVEIKSSGAMAKLPKDTQELKNWLTVHELDRYFHNFVVNGYSSILFVKDIDDVQDLINIGIKSKDDQNKLIHLIQLQLNNNTVMDEGESNVQMHVQMTSR